MINTNELPTTEVIYYSNYKEATGSFYHCRVNILYLNRLEPCHNCGYSFEQRYCYAGTILKSDLVGSLNSAHRVTSSRLDIMLFVPDSR